MSGYQRPWFTVAVLYPNGNDRCIFDGPTTKARAIARAHIWQDATGEPVGTRILVLRGKHIGRLIYELRIGADNPAGCRISAPDLRRLVQRERDGVVKRP
jgi:hypothetical protein